MPTNHTPWTGAVPTPAAAPAGLTAGQVARWAEVIADGRDAVPDDLPPADRTRLEAAVRARLRDRLVRYIARAIAADLYGRRETRTSETVHDREEV